MGSFANSIFSVLLGWIRGAVNQLWALLNSDSGGGFLAWIGENWKVLTLLLCGIGVVVDLVVYLFRFCKEGKWVKVALAMIIGGGIGNMIDRVALGYVVDFVDFTLIHFAVFNVADSFVSVGAVMLVIWFVRSMVTEYRNGKKKKADGTSEEHDDGTN